MNTKKFSTQKRWEPKWALITGSSQGLGKDLAEEFARQGISLVLVARRGDILEKLSQEWSSRYGVVVHTITADLSNPEGIDTVWQWCKKNSLWPDILVNNAGRGLFGSFENQTEGDLHKLLYLNIESVTFLCHRFGPKIAEKHGLILNVSSLVALIPTPFFAVYSATKSYILHLSRALAAEWKKQLTVSCLLPGYMRTGFDTNAGITDPNYLRLSSTLGHDTIKVAPFVVKQILKRKPIIYLSTGDWWTSQFLSLIPPRLRALGARMFLKRFAQKQV